MRLLVSLLLGLTISAQAALPARADSFSSTAAVDRPLVRHAGLLDYFTGDRSRMIQATTIGFGLGIVILMTATRKH